MAKITASPKYLTAYLNKRCDWTLYDIGALSKWGHVDLIIIIPAYKEDYPIIKNTLDSLSIINLEDLKIGILVLVNYKDTDNITSQDASKSLYRQLQAYTFDNPQIYYQSFIKELQGKHKGVGQARKLLMDAALALFNHNKYDGLIINLDADTTVDNRYALAIHETFAQKPHMMAASIAYTHPLSGVNQEAIINYELHLRYFINIQKWVGLPYAFQTVGSAMAVRSLAYAKEGGMNLRQAGEDFYFLHKYTKITALGEINSTIVTPSNRTSDRVPFGTGKAIADYHTKGKLTYHPAHFIGLKRWLSVVEDQIFNDEWTLPPVPSYGPLRHFLESVGFDKAWERIANGAKQREAKYRSFYAWFDAFNLFKYLHFAREEGLADVALGIAVPILFDLVLLPYEEHTDLRRFLEILRHQDLQQDYADQWRAGLNSRLSRITAS